MELIDDAQLVEVFNGWCEVELIDAVNRPQLFIHETAAELDAVNSCCDTTGTITVLRSCIGFFAASSDAGTEHAILTGYGRISGSFREPKVCSGVFGDTGGDGYRPTPRIAFLTDSVRFNG